MDIATSRGAVWGLRLFFVAIALFLYAPSSSSRSSPSTMGRRSPSHSRVHDAMVRGLVSNELLIQSLRASLVVAMFSA
jgi:hypothetical protein